MTDCIFCKIINRDIPSYTVYEDDDVYAFLDITQTTKGHTLIIPKQHVSDIFEYDEKLAATLFSKVPKIARALEKSFPDMEGLNLVNNNKELAYQSVFHSHIHLIPRYSKEDDFSMTFADNGSQYTTEEMTRIANTIKENIVND
ncbi:MAG: HIT family protein [Vagococcus sp.]|uniref:HIT family protein n=1 Tax=Vagococcus sp. TaxID=1933889 RepID=UPI002FC69F09